MLDSENQMLGFSKTPILNGPPVWDLTTLLSELETFSMQELSDELWNTSDRDSAIMNLNESEMGQLLVKETNHVEYLEP